MTAWCYIVSLDNALKEKLKNPTNALAYRFGKYSPILFHVGVQRVEKELQRFVQQGTDATQRKNLIFVVGPPKSGKTAEAMVVIPYLLEPHIHKVVLTEEAKLPCYKVYIDCFALTPLRTYKSKLWNFYQTVANQLKIPRDPKLTEDTVHQLHLKDLFLNLSNYHIITIDEYPRLFANLSDEDSTRLADELRNILLDPGIR